MRRLQAKLLFAMLVLPCFLFGVVAEGTDLSQSPKVWQLVDMQEHGLLDTPAPPDDGSMSFSNVSYDENGGQFVVTIGMRKSICPETGSSESIIVKWSFNSDIRTLRPGSTIPITIGLSASKIHPTCERQAISRTEIHTTWSELSPPAEYFPDSEKPKYWRYFSAAKPAPNRRFNYYVSGDPSTSSGYTELMVNGQTVPSPTDPQYGWFAILVSSSGCCWAKNEKLQPRGNHAFYYIYKLSGGGPTPQTATFNDPRTENGNFVDRCYAFASGCDDNDNPDPAAKPAANEFCRRKGFRSVAPGGSRWSYKAPTETLSSGQTCNDAKACGGLDFVTCQ